MESKTSTFYKYSAATQGFVLWSVWAFYINSKVSFSAGVTSGLTQGLFSFVSTLIVISLLTRLFNYFQRPFFKLLLPPLMMTLVLMMVLVIIHNAVGTPKIVQTIAPSVVVAALFCAFTTHKLNAGVKRI